MTKAHKRAVDAMIRAGPAAGYPGACGRPPMMHQLMDERFGVWYAVHDLSQLLKNRGFSYQKARVVSDHKDPPTRQEWLTP